MLKTHCATSVQVRSQSRSLCDRICIKSQEIIPISRTNSQGCRIYWRLSAPSSYKSSRGREMGKTVICHSTPLCLTIATVKRQRRSPNRCLIFLKSSFKWRFTVKVQAWRTKTYQYLYYCSQRPYAVLNNWLFWLHLNMNPADRACMPACLSACLPAASVRALSPPCGN